MWLYEYTTKFGKANERKVPRICSWANRYRGKKYDTGQILSNMKDKEVCDVVFLLCVYIIVIEV